MSCKNVVALLSGGKDSLYNMYLATKDEHHVVAIANLRPPSSDKSDELDSYMYQTVGHQAIDHIARALEIPLFRSEITGTPKNKDLYYENDSTQEDEVEQLYHLLKSIRDEHGIDFNAVSVGAIASSYQKSRVENVCQRLGIEMLAYLWNKDQDQLLQSMIDDKFEAILIKVACMGLTGQHLGCSISDMQSVLRKLNLEYGTNICGEGGEYETLVLDCPMYKKRLELDSYEKVCHSQDVFAPVYYIRPLKISLVDK
jgi:diphthine-ammonia ligase